MQHFHTSVLVTVSIEFVQTAFSAAENSTITVAVQSNAEDIPFDFVALVTVELEPGSDCTCKQHRVYIYL